MSLQKAEDECLDLTSLLVGDADTGKIGWGRQRILVQQSRLLGWTIRSRRIEHTSKCSWRRCILLA